MTRRPLATVALLVLIALLSACEDELIHPPCDPTEASYPDGLQGHYAVANRESSPGSWHMEPTTEHFRLEKDPEGGFRAFTREGAGSSTPRTRRSSRETGFAPPTSSGAPAEIPSLPVSEFFGSMGAIGCKAAGRWYIGTQSEKGTWTLAELNVHGGGFLLIPQSFRRGELREAGVAWTLQTGFSFDQIARYASEDGPSFPSEDSGLLIDNRKVPLERLVAVARPFHVVQNFSRVPEGAQPPPRRSGKGLSAWREIARSWSGR